MRKLKRVNVAGPLHSTCLCYRVSDSFSLSLSLFEAVCVCVVFFFVRLLLSAISEAHSLLGPMTYNFTTFLLSRCNRCYLLPLIVSISFRISLSGINLCLCCFVCFLVQSHVGHYIKNNVRWTHKIVMYTEKMRKTIKMLR